MATEITVIRHGETEWNFEKRIQGQHNSNLTENGIVQAQQVAKALTKRRFDILISSDLGRAVETADIIKEKLGLPCLLNSNLRERSFGIVEGQTQKEMRETCPADFEKYKSREPDTAFPEGESLAQLYDRAVAEIDKIAEQYEGKKVLVVAHGLILEMMMYRTFNISLDTPRFFTINNASINTFVIDNGKWLLKEWGVIEHLLSLNVLNELW